jgi:BolA protein
VVSQRFAGQGRVARQRLVFAALDGLMREQVHALSIRARAPGEATGSG